MKKKTILSLIFVLIVILSITLTYNIYKEKLEKQDDSYYSDDATADDIIVGMNWNLLDEDDEVEIGEMI
ncbi:hypothetical protein B6U98_03525 [Thermoplasmatales archaeon ex4572_165]|nr:MAG: hypothetical protein B6U98_03525 [Thermoplasmatales archaeon ex4572_165]RLF59122.1 MAG: hypothetical protein DRN27_03585 [Thermoplasmata archaeon]